MNADLGPLARRLVRRRRMVLLAEWRLVAQKRGDSAQPSPRVRSMR